MFPAGDTDMFHVGVWPTGQARGRAESLTVREPAEARTAVLEKFGPLASIYCCFPIDPTPVTPEYARAMTLGDNT
jgi:hypothetical protein